MDVNATTKQCLYIPSLCQLHESEEALDVLRSQHAEVEQTNGRLTEQVSKVCARPIGACGFRLCADAEQQCLCG